jgi:hypothetical protein
MSNPFYKAICSHDRYACPECQPGAEDWSERVAADSFFDTILNVGHPQERQKALEALSDWVQARVRRELEAYTRELGLEQHVKALALEQELAAHGFYRIRGQPDLVRNKNTGQICRLSQLCLTHFTMECYDRVVLREGACRWAVEVLR